MANFDTGVKGYVKTYCVVEVNFPIDWKGNEDIRCEQCPYYSKAKRLCNLNGTIVEYPDNFVGSNCPLERKEEEND